MTRFTSLLLIALVLVVAARAQTNNRPCSAQAAAVGAHDVRGIGRCRDVGRLRGRRALPVRPVGFVASAAVWMFRTVGKMLDRAELDRQAYMTSQQRCAEDHREERREWLASAEANQTAMRAAVDRLTDAIERKGV